MRDLKSIQKFLEDNHPDKELIYLYKAGSHFFDLNTPSSDLDLKGIYITKPQYYTRKKRMDLVEYNTNDTSKNNKDDIDLTLFSLEKFLNLLKVCDFNMMEALFAPDKKVLYETSLIQELKMVRNSLLIKDSFTFIAFFKKEYKKHKNGNIYYQQRKKMYNLITKHDLNQRPALRLEDIVDDLKTLDFVEFHNAIVNKQKNTTQMMLHFALHRYAMRTRLNYIAPQLERYINQTSDRTKSQSFKGYSHCLRLLYQAQDLLNFGEFKFPFDKKRLSLLQNIKNKKIDEKTVDKIIHQELADVLKLQNTKNYNNQNVLNYLDSIINRFQSRFSILNKIEVYK